MVKLTDVLEMNYWDFNRALMELSEQRCRRLLDLEKIGYARYSYMYRIVVRFNVLRCQRERKQGTYDKNTALNRFAAERTTLATVAKVGRKDNKRNGRK